MSIGITIYPAKPLFESGANQTALQLGEMVSTWGMKVVYLHSGLHSWWSDYPLPSYATEGHYHTLSSNSLDLLIDVDGTLVGEVRERIAKRTIVFLRSFLQFSEMDRSVYIECPYVPRSMDAVTEVWCWDQLNPKETIPSIQTMFSCPIRRVPFFWSPTITEYYSKGKLGYYSSTQKVYTTHVAEKGTNESSSVVPLVAICEAVKRKISPTMRYEVHHMDPFAENRFFKENVATNIQLDKLPILVHPKKTVFYEWTIASNQVFFSHSRFTYLRPSLLHLIWLNIPLFHNSPILKDLHPSLKRGFYHGNEICEWLQILSTFESQPSVWWEGLEERRNALLRAFGLSVHSTEWETIVKSVLDSSSVTPPSLSVTPPSSSVSSTVIPSIASPLPSKKKCVVAFSDMWQGFPFQRNTLIDSLQHHHPEVEVTGVEYKTYPYPDEINVLMVGLFGQDWKKAPAHLPKIQLNGENWEQKEDPAIHLFLSNSHQEDQKHVRFPTWMWFVDWYTTSTQLPPSDSTDNPIRLPLCLATNPHSKPYLERPAFCGFVVSNPICSMRNQTFQLLNQYKKVNSGGSLYNNIGGPLSLKYPGGGAGDLSKHDFFTNHRFTLSFENSQAHGYITEKLLHSKMAGCIPIYWGDVHADHDFDPDSFLQVSALQTPEQVVNEIKTLESDRSRCEKMAATPILDEERAKKALHQLERVSSRIWELIYPSSPSLSSPPVNPWKATYIVNLDSRPDRFTQLQKEEPQLFRQLTPQRVSAINGRELALTETIYRLFERNEFGWKKGVMGCALSHLDLWKRIVQHGEDGYYLVLEDDVRFKKDWWSQQTEYVRAIPEDAELVYLGGVLPPNRPALPSVLEPKNPYWSEIKWNTLFTPHPTPIFHFCTYSYAIHRRGAIKLLRFLMESNKRFTVPVDHFLMNPLIGLRKYVARELPARCFQDDDPSYIQSDFNNLQRKDVFDSDICNNTECFQTGDLSRFDTQPSKNPKHSMILYMMVESEDAKLDLYERTWLEDMFQKKIECRPLVSIVDADLPSDAWYMVQRPHSQKWNKWFHHLQRKNIPFRILHLSDEFVSDMIGCYTLPNCKAVVRNYMRPDLPALPYVKTIPLGYHHKANPTTYAVFSERKWVWSFHGTEWFGRREKLEPFQAFQPNDCRFQPSWNHSSGSSESEYLKSLSQSKYCPIMAGNNVETFRLYEALEAGALPVTTITDKEYLDQIEKELGLSSLYGWENPIEVIQLNRGSNEIQTEVRKRWSEWKKRIQSEISSL